SPLLRLPLLSPPTSWPSAFVINSALAGSKVAPARPKPFRKERRPTSRRPRESRFASAEGIVRASLDAFRPLFRSFFIRYAAGFSGCSRSHEIAVTALFGCNIYTRTPSILFHRHRKNFSLSTVARASRPRASGAKFRPRRLAIEMVTNVIHVLHCWHKQIGHTCAIRE